MFFSLFMDDIFYDSENTAHHLLYCFKGNLLKIKIKNKPREKIYRTMKNRNHPLCLYAAL